MSDDQLDRVLFNTSTITSISDPKLRYLSHLRLLVKMEGIVIDDPDIVHKALYVVTDDGKKYLMDFSSFYMNSILWLFNSAFGFPIIEDNVYDMSDSTKGSYLGIMNKIISRFVELGCDFDKYDIISTVKQRIVRIARIYGDIMANTFSLYDIMALETRSPEFADIYNRTLSDDMSPSAAEEYLEAASQKFYEIIEKDASCCLYPFITSNMLKKLQVGQMFVGVGPRIDIDKSILPVMIKQGWMHGMKTNSEFFAESVTTRNAIIVKKEAVPDSGYLSRKVNLACLNTELDSSIYDCGTKFYLSYYVKNHKHLEILEGKYMLIDEAGPILKEISIKDSHLIGTTVKIRSHTKCITGHRLNKVCSICFGNKHKILKDCRIGGFVGIKLINPLTQLGMSSKHATGTSAEEITGDTLFRYFIIENNNICLKKSDNNIKILIPFEVVSDIISSENIIDSKEVEDGLDYSKYIDMLFVVENGVLRAMDLEDKSFFINISDYIIGYISNSGAMDMVRYEDVVDSIAEVESENKDVNWENEFQDMEFVSISIENLDHSEPIFSIKLLTEEVSKYLRITKSIIDGAKTSLYTCPEDPIVDFIDILFKADLTTKGMMIHIETLIMNLMRSENDSIIRPDYSTKIEPNVKFVKLTQAIQKADLFSSIAFQELRRQLKDPQSLKKSVPGIFDIFFKNQVFEDNGKEFRQTRKYLF